MRGFPQMMEGAAGHAGKGPDRDLHPATLYQGVPPRSISPAGHDAVFLAAEQIMIGVSTDSTTVVLSRLDRHRS
ncbi:hypothetical protein BMF89_07910 [Arthrobacter sp. SRS-W-1-2016]|jgi:hypothetical protein|nr:hypothetical protein BMF89_07910 [Arthrobacter sp. SRS-W-1-2016]